MRILVVLGLLATPLSVRAVPAPGPAELSAQTGFFFRELYVKSATPDGKKLRYTFPPHSYTMLKARLA